MRSENNGANDKLALIACLAALIAIMAPFLADSYTPSLPAITHALHSSVNVMQLTMSLYIVGAALAQLVYGPCSDRFGRKPMIIIGLITSVVGSLLCAVANVAWFILVARFVQGIGAGACNGLFRAIMRDSFSGSRLSQVASYIGMLYTTAFAIAPVMGGYWQEFSGWRASFVFVTLLVFIVTLVIWRFLPETNQRLNPSAVQLAYIIKHYKELLTNPIFVGYATIASISIAFFIAYYTTAPFLLENLARLTPVQFAWVSTFTALGGMIGQFFNARFVVKYGTRRLLFFGAILLNISSMLMLAAALLGWVNAWVIVVPMVGISIGAGMIFANAMAGAFQAFAHIAGFAGAIYGCIQMLGSSIPSLLLASIHEESQLPLAIIFTGLALLLSTLFYLLQRKEKSYAS